MPIFVHADTVRAKINNISYIFNKDKQTATVTFNIDSIYHPMLEYYDFQYKGYEGNVVIPESVTFEGVIYSVTGIDADAFSGIYETTSGPTSVTIPNSVTTIGDRAFWMAPLSSIHIPASVTNIGKRVFSECGNLSKITVDSKNPHFDSRDGCNAIIETNSNKLLYGCRNTVIPNSITIIGDWAFGASIPNPIIIPSKVEDIGNGAFAPVDCYGNFIVYCYSPNPPKASNSTFPLNAFQDDSYYDKVILYVLSSSYEAYKTTEPWSSFTTIMCLDGTTPDDPKCATPTISYDNGILAYNGETEGVKFVSEITDDDINTYTINRISLNVTYNITVYATKSGYDNSDVATATLCWIDAEPAKEGIDEIPTTITEVKARPILIQSRGGVLTVSGMDDGTLVQVYTLDGRMATSAVSNDGEVQLAPCLTHGTTAIVKVGNKSVKFLVE